MPLHWTTREVEMLEQLAIDQPPDLLATTYNIWASCHGFPQRTHHALRIKAARHGITEKACGDWMSVGYIRQVLGVSRGTTNGWTNLYGIPCHRGGRGARFFLRSDLISAARDKPEIFGGISADRLFLLLEDRELADKIAATHKWRVAQPRPIRAVETGWRYPSITDAAIRSHVDRRVIQKAIRTGGTAAGYHWTYA